MTDTVDIAEKTAPFRSPKDSLPLAASAEPNGRSAADTLPLQDSTARNGRSAADTVAIGERAPARDSRAKDVMAISDGLPIVQANVFRPVSATDVVAISENRQLDRRARDKLEFGEKVLRDGSARDTMVLSDSPLVERGVYHEVAASDTVAIGEKGPPVRDSRARDIVALSDVPSAQKGTSNVVTATDVVAIGESRSAFRSPVDRAEVAEVAALPTRSTSSVVDIADAAASRTVGVKISDGAGFADSASIGPGINIGEAVGVADALGIRPSVVRLQDSVAASDGVGGHALREKAVSDSLGFADALAASRGTVIHDSVGAADQFAGVSVHWDRAFAEPLGLQDCTPFACNQILHFNESVALGGEFVPPPAPADALVIGDGIARSAVLGRSAGDAAVVADSRAGWTWNAAPVAPPPGSLVPALNMMISSDAAAVKPLPGTPVAGTYTMLTPGQLVNQLNPPVLSVSGWESYPDPSRVAMVLPIYQVNLAPTPQLPGDDAMLTARVAQVPANMPVVVPVDLSRTPQASEHSNVPWMKVEYVPGVSSADFAMVMAIIDSPPAGAQQPQADFKAMYVDFEWVGSFSGPDPGSAGHYRSPPTFTFAISDSWASQQRVQRDSNGVPVMSVSLLDEGTGGWLPARAIDYPAGPVDGQYVYVAHLEHFSTYAITANKAVIGSGGRIQQEQVAPSVAAQAAVADSVAVGDDAKPLATGFIEEFSKNKSVTVRLSDRLYVATKPVAYGEIVLAGKEVKARMTLEGVETDEGAFGKAVAAVLVQLENKGSKPELLVLDYLYMDRAGRVAYESSRVVELGPGELKLERAEIPFTEPGKHVLLVEARSDAGELLGTMQAEVEVPWLTVNLYPFMAVVAAIFVAAVAVTAAYVLRRTAPG